ncbi:hypothetical protein KFL_004840075 [Klebsormidium nitens]|uniref:Uncharacterized protein n=1 Tax=Klebsormidium nitens TaxID=105231 RepID=A0A1Y1ILT1_KLENI|nr:hypothetical protein KFL_004840075 [Klebsormidium nitens]|eukprot:GAQ89068.1 hypothetical protein KFL_004840075 [Klebsormidium nitens]
MARSESTFRTAGESLVGRSNWTAIAAGRGSAAAQVVCARGRLVPGVLSVAARRVAVRGAHLARVARISVDPRVVKCQRKWEPFFEFYQVQAPNSSCDSEYPPPVITVAHPSRMAASGIVFWALFTLAYISLVIGGSALVGYFLVLTVYVSLIAGLFIYCILQLLLEWIKFKLWPKARVPVESSTQKLTNIETGSAKSATGSREEHDQSVTINGVDFRVWLAERVQKILYPVAPYLFLVILFLAPFVAYRAAKDLLTKATKVEDLGPVPLPDPSHGLNQYLEEKTAGIQLELCERMSYNFYVGVPGGCAWRPDPYSWQRVALKELQVSTKDPTESNSVGYTLASMAMTGLMLVMLVLLACAGKLSGSEADLSVAV